MPNFAELATVTRQDIRNFDTEAKKLVDLFHEAGWRSYMSNNSHAILQAPDGETTASVSGHNNRAQVRRGRQELKRWLIRNRKQSKTLPGPSPRSHEHEHEPENRSQEPAMTTTTKTCPDCPGREFKSGGALALHRQRTHDGMTCPECGEKFMGGGNSVRYNQHRLEQHGITRKKKLEVKAVDGVFPCPYCTAQFGTRIGLGSHQKVHKDQIADASTNGASNATTTAPPAVAVRPSSTPLPVLRPVLKKAKPQPAVEATSEPAPDGSPDLDQLLGETDPAEALTNVLAILAPPLLGQIERLRRERDDAREQVKALTTRVEEFETRMSIINDAMTL